MNTNVTFVLGSLKILPLELKICFKEHPVDVTLTEMMSREELSQKVWENQAIQPSTLNTHISNIRVKFKDWEYEIFNLKKQGYRLVSK